jgi:hypothetical protein
MTDTRQHRRRRIRRTVGAASLATFALAWGVIAGTGSMGHGSSTATAAPAATAASGSSASTSSARQSDAASRQQLPAMTTQQS